MINRRDVALFFIGCIAISALCISLYFTGSGGAAKPEVDTFDVKMLNIITEETEKARMLSKNGEALKSAILYRELAAAEQVLFLRNDITRKSVKPSGLEIIALHQSSAVNADFYQDYKKILMLKYPNWHKPEPSSPSDFNLFEQ